MLQEHGGRERVDIALATTGGPTHLANGAKRGRSGEPLVNETRGKACPFLQLGGNVPSLGGAGRVVAILVEWKADDEAFDLELLTAPNHLRDRRAFAPAPQDETGRRCDRSRRVADGEADATITVVDGEEANASRPAPSAQRIPCCSASA